MSEQHGTHDDPPSFSETASDFLARVRTPSPDDREAAREHAFAQLDKVINEVGGKFWCVSLVDKTEVSVYGRSMEVIDGALVIRRGNENNDVNLAFAHGQWRWGYAASCLSGGPVAVDQWPGYLSESDIAHRARKAGEI